MKQEKKDEKRLNKERRLELRRLELEKAKELKKPNEDMCLADHKVVDSVYHKVVDCLTHHKVVDCLTHRKVVDSVYHKVVDSV